MSPPDVASMCTIDLLSLSDCHRWITIKTGKRQSVAEHSFNVAVIAVELVARLFHPVPIELQYEVMTWGIIHDAPEALTGDINGRFKWAFPAVKAAVRGAEAEAFPWYKSCADTTKANVKAIVKLADLIEAITFIKVWGIDKRAKSVALGLTEELLGYVYESASAIGVPAADVFVAVDTVMQVSTSELSSIQFRLKR